MERLLQTVFTTLLVLGLFSTAFSQPGQSDDAEINSTANVLSQISVTGNQNLNFGDVSPGVNKAISYDDANNAGQFSVSAGADAKVSLEFTSLPDELVGQDDNSNTLAISYTNTDANWEEDNGSADPSNGSNEFDPSSTETINEFPSNGILVYIGGQVEPTNEQSAEVYQGTITLSATYN